VARAFACDPEIILMDEPFSALDPITRLQLQDELAGLQAAVQKTIVFVTHDMDEAVKIADKICIINDGGIAQYDTVEEIMKNPANDFVAKFMGRNRIWSSPEFIRAKDIMIQDPVCGFADMSVLHCIEKMRTQQVDSLLIISREGLLRGILTAKHAQTGTDKQSPVSRFMQTGFETVRGEQNIIEVLSVINKSGLSAVPVVGEGNLLEGLITKSSLLTTLSQQYTDGREGKSS
jgi:osmoprotectant transport system ATP-binding protein